MQLNIGIIAACASFLKPLLGRLLKINSSVGYYPSDQPYNRSGPYGGGSNVYGNRSRKNGTGTGIGSRALEDEFELHTKNGASVEAHGVSSTGTRSEHGREEYGGGGSDNNSDEIILQGGAPTPGIMCTKDFTVDYSSK